MNLELPHLEVADDDDVATVTNRMVDAVSCVLRNRRLHLVTMESCTAGGISYVMSQRPGASSVLIGGNVTYTNEQKVAMGVGSQKIRNHTAVSMDVAGAMAFAAQSYAAESHPFRQVCSVSTTGNIDERAEVYVGAHVYGTTHTLSRKHLPGSSRTARQEAAILIALDFLLGQILLRDV